LNGLAGKPLVKRHTDESGIPMKNCRKLAAGPLLALLATLPLPLAACPHELPESPRLLEPAADAPRVSREKSGTLPTKDGLRLRVNTDLGDVHIFTDASGQVSYRVTLETDPREPGAEQFLNGFALAARTVASGISIDGKVSWRAFRGRLWVNYEIHIPRRYGLDVNTQAGNIDVQDIQGRVILATAGGNISAGRVNPPETTGLASDRTEKLAAQLETQGGHITIGDVAGSVRAATAGGHIAAGNIEGDATLHSGGGHIRAGRIAGVAKLDTGGGNIQVASAGSNVTASTGGGQIEFGEAAGDIRAHTGGGAVRIEHISGPAAVEATGGSVFLRQVDGPLHVSAATGNITASFAEGRGTETIARAVRPLPGASRLESVDGDIIVYLPRELAVTIDAIIEQGGAHRILADPSLALKLSYQDSKAGTRAVRGQCDMNGGGGVLYLKALSGNIVLRLGEPDSGRVSGPEPSRPPGWRAGRDGDESDHEPEGFFNEVRRRIQTSWWGGVPIETSELQKRLAYSVAPVYPEVARQAGMEGDVVLRAYISSDGRVASLKVLSGSPVLARAAIKAVEKWRYQPVLIHGQPVNVVTTLTVAFRLQ
jgi:TonB family protein